MSDSGPTVPAAGAIAGAPNVDVAHVERQPGANDPRHSALEREVDLAISSLTTADAQARASVVDRAFRIAICNAHLGLFDDARLWRDRALEQLRLMRPEDMELLHFQAEARAALEVGSTADHGKQPGRLEGG